MLAGTNLTLNVKFNRGTINPISAGSGYFFAPSPPLLFDNVIIIIIYLTWFS